MNRIVGIREASLALGVSISTLRRWEATGKLAADHTAGGHRRYDLSKLKPELFYTEDVDARRTIAYARVSSKDQQADLEHVLEIITVFSARLYGSRSHKNKKLLSGMKRAVEES